MSDLDVREFRALALDLLAETFPRSPQADRQEFLALLLTEMEEHGWVELDDEDLVDDEETE